MQLNTIAPAIGSKKKAKRVGRGIGCTQGKTCGRGHKGQHARAGGYHKIGFEGGQMPLQRRLPKVGFKSKSAQYYGEIRLSELNNIDIDGSIDIQSLKSANLISKAVKQVKVIDSGDINKPTYLKGLKVTKGAAKKIEKSGGKIEV